MRWIAAKIVRDAGVSSHDTVGQLGALHRYVRDEITFLGDISNVETLQSPRYTLASRAGDCDDRAVLLSALAGTIGIPTSFKLIGADPRSPGRFSHVYVLARLGGRQIAMDPTYGNNALGWEYSGPTRTMEVPV